MVRGSRWFVSLGMGSSLALLVSSACGQAADDDAPGPAQAPGTDAPQADAPQDDALVPNAVLDVGDSAVPWTPGVTVVDAGKAPAPLAAPPELGSVRPIVIAVQASRTAKKRARRWPRVRVSGTSTLASASADASRRALTLSTLDANPSKAFDDAMLATLRAQLPVGPASFELVSDAHAATTALGWPTAATDPKAQEVGQAVAHALSHLTLPLPDVPVGRNGRFEIRRIVDLMGLPMQQTLTLRVDKVQGKQIELSGTVRYALVPDADVGGALGLAAVKDAHATGKLALRLHTPSATPIEMHLTLDLVAKGPAGEQRTWLDLRVDEDYLATPDRRVQLRGEFTQGGVVLGRVPPETKIWFDRHKQRVSPAGDFVLGFGRTADDRALLSMQFPGADVERHVVSIAPRDFPEERIDGLDPKLVDLDRATKKALAASHKRIDKIRSKVTTVPYFAEGFQWPLKGRITSTYGRSRVLNGEDHGPHWGVDVAVPVGKPVKAPAAGVVVFAEHDVPLSGSTMVIDHGHGLTSSLLHLKAFKAKTGDVVKAGQVVATSGNSGRSTGPHLDWRMNLRDIRVDPETIVDKR